MKRFLLLAFCLPGCMACFAKDTDGYIVLPNNDTVWVKLRLPGALFANYNLFRKLKVVDSADKVTEYTPAELKAFGYTDKKGRHDYRTKPIQDSAVHPFYFLEVLVDGRKACLYDYWITMYGGNGTST